MEEFEKRSLFSIVGFSFHKEQKQALESILKGQECLGCYSNIADRIRQISNLPINSYSISSTVILCFSCLSSDFSHEKPSFPFDAERVK